VKAPWAEFWSFCGLSTSPLEEQIIRMTFYTYRNVYFQG
jgi:hypothetical protein